MEVFLDPTRWGRQMWPERKTSGALFLTCIFGSGQVADLTVKFNCKYLAIPMELSNHEPPLESSRKEKSCYVANSNGGGRFWGFYFSSLICSVTSCYKSCFLLPSKFASKIMWHGIQWCPGGGLPPDVFLRTWNLINLVISFLIASFQRSCNSRYFFWHSISCHHWNTDQQEVG